MLFFALSAVALLYVGYHGWLAAALWRKQAPQSIPTHPSWPSVSILIPARNEAKNITTCLESLRCTDYPGTWDVWVGNDRSTDNTAACVSALMTQMNNLHLVSIDKNIAHLAGKQNVLAQLAQCTTSDICLVVDADCTVQSSWVTQLVLAFDTPEVGMVSGPTVVEASHALGRLQAIDWRYGMGSFQALAERGLPVTAVGNNMGWRRSAYQALGGYTAIPFSLVEDFQLFQSMRLAGFAIRFPAFPTIVNRSAAVIDLATLLRQRRRWLRGARQSGAPLYARLPFITQWLFTLGLVVAVVALPWPWALGLLALKLATDAVFLASAQRRFTPQAPLPWAWLLPHQAYLLLAMLLLPLYLYWPGHTVWKGRAIPS